MSKRALTARQAVACENAQGKVCRCRCGGALHGLSHDVILQRERTTGLTWEVARLQTWLPGLAPEGEEAC